MLDQPVLYTDPIENNTLDKASMLSMSESCITVETDESISSVESESMPSPSSACLGGVHPKAHMKRKRSSIRAFDVSEIPIKNRGWKTLPKVTNEALLRSCTVGQRTQQSVTVSQKVSFSNVEFRCFEQCVGDNPSVSIGTPISLDWDYEDMEAINVDAYEESRGQRRTPRQLMMNYFQRRTLLSYCCGLSEAEIDAAEKATNRVRNQRTLTRTLLPASMIEDLVTSAARKTKRALSMKKEVKTSFQYQPAPALSLDRPSQSQTMLQPEPEVLPLENRIEQIMI